MNLDGNFELKNHIKECRKLIIEMTLSAGSGHPGPSLSAVDIIATLYFNKMNVNIHNPKWIDRDRFILSKGHAAPALYAVLIEKGFIPRKEIYGFRKIGGNLQGHPSIKTPGVDVSSGSLGLGLSAACGMALAAKLKKNGSNIYCLIGDGECDEGQVWEAALFAANFGLDNLYVFIDRNLYQYEGKTEDVMKLEPLKEKWQSFGWCVWNIDGNDPDQILEVLLKAKIKNYAPKVIIAHTVKGKGISFMEENQDFHAKAPTEEQAEAALLELSNKEV